MTQIKKTLSIAGIIAMVGAPAMADIASTQYVQNALSGITSALDAKLSNNATDTFKSVAIGDAATAVGGTFADEPVGAVAVGKGASASGYGATAIGSNAQADAPRAIMLGEGYNDEPNTLKIGFGMYDEDGFDLETYTLIRDGKIPLGMLPDGLGENKCGPDSDMCELWGGSVYDKGSLAIGGAVMDGVERSMVTGRGTVNASDSIVIGNGELLGEGSILIGQAGGGVGEYYADADHTFFVFLGDADEDCGADKPCAITYPLLKSGGIIPAERLTGLDSTRNLTSNKVLQFNSATKTMSWVDAPAPSLTSILPAQPNTCKASTGQKCALVTTWDGSKYTYDWEVVKSNQ